MTDDGRGREHEADDAERRQREGELTEAGDRAADPPPDGATDEAGEDQPPPAEAVDEPGADAAVPVDDDDRETLGDLDAALADQEYPTTTSELIASYGDRSVESRDGRTSVRELLESTDQERYDSAADVRRRLLGLLHR